ncbi:hypothetical protein BD310DRAFT_877231 [Dichomitus squalens]|uniref:Uncharacterized protein n=1 Tax=Dichomitus squalens TaxID=114155 RepID=A0A4Q9PX48_9APHY|nr:hypothetical protein BD310DRAFT_877231 [Dichomitus squalens]
MPQLCSSTWPRDGSRRRVTSRRTQRRDHQPRPTGPASLPASSRPLCRRTHTCSPGKPHATRTAPSPSPRQAGRAYFPATNAAAVPCISPCMSPKHLQTSRDPGKSVRLTYLAVIHVTAAADPL